MKKKTSLITKIHVRIGEKVTVISGQDKGKTGLVKKIVKHQNKLIIEGVNIKVKHIKANRSGQTGEIKRIEFPIHSSNVSRYEE